MKDKVSISFLILRENNFDCIYAVKFHAPPQKLCLVKHDGILKFILFEYLNPIPGRSTDRKDLYISFTA